MSQNTNKSFWLFSVFAVLVLAGIGVYMLGRGSSREAAGPGNKFPETLGSVILPVHWNSLGRKLVEAGVLDADKLEALYEQRGGLTDAEKEIIAGDYDGEIILTPANSGLWLNMLWALGLGNKNEILTAGEMSNPQYGGAGVFASTGGWTLARGLAMNHYGAHDFIALTAPQQALVEEASRNVYRPCCNNSTHFPDCNHGMAMLGLLQLAASQGADEDALYSIAFAANSAWFSGQYAAIRQYFEGRGEEWSKVDPRIVLGRSYSSYSGYERVLAEVSPPTGSGSSCGV